MKADFLTDPGRRVKKPNLREEMETCRHRHVGKFLELSLRNQISARRWKQHMVHAEVKVFRVLLRNQISARRWKPIIALVLGDLRNTTLRNQISARRWKLLPAFCLRLLPSLRNQISARRWKQASVNVMFSCLLVKKPNLREEMETFTSGSSSAGTSSLRNQISARRWKLESDRLQIVDVFR